MYNLANDYSINDTNYYDDRSQNNQDSKSFESSFILLNYKIKYNHLDYVNEDWNSDRNYSYPQNNQYRNERNYCKYSKQFSIILLYLF